MINNYPNQRRPAARKKCPYCGELKCARGVYSHIRLKHPEMLAFVNVSGIKVGQNMPSGKPTSDTVGKVDNEEVKWILPENIRKNMQKIPYEFLEKFGPPTHKANWEYVIMPNWEMEVFQREVYALLLSDIQLKEGK